MRYTVRHSTIYSYTDPVPVCHNQVRLTPRATTGQTCREHQLMVDPQPSIRTVRRDYFGNEVEYFSIQEAHDGLCVTATSIVEVSAPARPKGEKSPAWEDVAAAIPNDSSADGLAVYLMTLASPRVRPSDALRDYAAPSFAP